MAVPSRRRQAAHFALLGALVLALPACNTFERMSEVGSAPSLGKIEDPQAQPGYKPVSMPMPAPQPAARNPNSLWRNGARAFFKDQRAAQVGDLLTITIAITDNAALANTSARSRTNSEHAGLPNLLGFETSPTATGTGAAATGAAAAAGSSMEKFLTGVDPSNLVNTNSTTSNNGTGSIARSETVNLKLAAVVTQTLPNGNLVIQGKQEVRVNFELRELTITGIIRPEDIDSTNAISYEKIAEARISYGGRGQITDVQQPRYGQQLFDILFPF